MTLLILRTMPRGGSNGSMSLFFAAMAVSDLALLYTGLLQQWLYCAVTLDLRELHEVICKIHVFLVYLSAMTSAWFLVAMTMQRVVSLLWLHRVGLLSTRRKVQVRMTLGCLTCSETVSPKCASMDLNKKQKGENLYGKFDHKEIILVNTVNCILSNCFVAFLKTIRMQRFGYVFVAENF